MVGFGGMVNAKGLFAVFTEARRAELVYGSSGRLRVAIMSFEDREHREEAEASARKVGWTARMAYSNRVGRHDGIRVETFLKSQV